MRGWDVWSRCYAGSERLLLGGSLMRARRRGLDRLRGASRVLLLGDGDGRFLAEALNRWPQACFVSVDGSPGMLAASQARIGAACRRAIWMQRRLPQEVQRLPAGPFDAVVTQFFVDCFAPNELEQWCPAVAARVRPGGVWHILEFSSPRDLRGWRRWRQATLLAFLYRAFWVSTGMRARRLPNMTPLFSAAGWELLTEERFEGGLYTATTWQRPRT